MPAEILEVEKFDEPMQKRVIDLIFGLGITKLVMGFSREELNWGGPGLDFYGM